MRLECPVTRDDRTSSRQRVEYRGPASHRLIRLPYAGAKEPDLDAYPTNQRCLQPAQPAATESLPAVLRGRVGRHRVYWTRSCSTGWS